MGIENPAGDRMDGAISRETASEAAFVPARTIEGNLSSNLLLLCDHAQNRLPPQYGDLGLSKAALSMHIAYDLGAEPLTRLLAERLGAAAVMACYSRLLIDPNRGEDDPTLIVSDSDGTPIPGNAAIDDAERQRRIAKYYLPYHQAIHSIVSAKVAAGQAPVLVSIHSFTPTWRGAPRPWHVGVLWETDPHFARHLIAELSSDLTIVVGDNEPYSGAAPTNSTLNKHAVSRELSHVLVEIRQDLLADEAGVEAWADRLGPVLSTL